MPSSHLGRLLNVTVFGLVYGKAEKANLQSEKAEPAKRERHITMGRVRRRQKETGPNGVVMIFQD